MLCSSLLALALSIATVTAAPTTTYKPCSVLTSPWKERFGRTQFSSTNSWLFSSALKGVIENGVVVSRNTALLNRDPNSWAETPGTGLLLIPGSKSLEPLKVAISYSSPQGDHVTYVETVKGETCVVPDSSKWTSVNAILNGEQDNVPLLDCQWSAPKSNERIANPNTEVGFDHSGATVESSDTFTSTVSILGDKQGNHPAINVHMVHHLGIFIEQDPAYEKVSKIAIDYVNIKGETKRTYAIANKTAPTTIEKGDMNASVYDKGFCKVQGSETWTHIKAVNFVISK